MSLRRSEEITTVILDQTVDIPTGQLMFLRVEIAKALEDCARDATEMKLHSLAKECQLWYERGASEMRERAATIADDEDCVVTDEVNCHGADRIAKKIRALRVGEEK